MGGGGVGGGLGGEGAVFTAHRGVWRPAGGDGERDGKPILGLEGPRPVVLKDVAIDQDTGGVFDLKVVLDGPGDAGEGGVAGQPGEGFKEVVAADLDVGGDEV